MITGEDFSVRSIGKPFYNYLTKSWQYDFEVKFLQREGLRWKFEMFTTAIENERDKDAETSLKAFVEALNAAVQAL